MGIRHSANGTARAQMRVGDGLRKIKHRPARDTMAFEGGDSLRSRGKGLQPGFDQVAQYVVVIPSRTRTGEARVGLQTTDASGSRKLLPLVWEHRYRDVFLVRVTEVPSGAAVGVQRTCSDGNLKTTLNEMYQKLGGAGQ